MGIVLIVLGLAAFCVLLYHIAVYILPFAIGLQIALWAIDTGAGALGGIAVGFVAGGMTFVIGQVVFATSRSLIIRWVVIVLFAVPAAIAGYSMVMQFSSEFGLVSSPIWQHVFAVISAVAIGGTAITRLAVPLPEPQPVRQRPTSETWPQPTGLQKSLLMPE